MNQIIRKLSPVVLILIAGSARSLAAGPFGASLELSTLNGENGFVINGVAVSDFSGYSVSGVGDVNGDGVADLIISALWADPNGINQAGACYVVFGGPGVGVGGTFELSSLNGTNGFVINGANPRDRIGSFVSSAGDLNGDGVDDIAVGVMNANPNGQSSGACYVIFGEPGVGAGGTFEVSSLNGTNGFVCNGEQRYGGVGSAVSSAGDINGDGVDDLVIGAPGDSDYSFSNGGSKSYVVFGGAGVGAGGSIELSSLNGVNGFVIDEASSGDESGSSVAGVGDVNGDGVDDLLIGAPKAGPNGNSSGESYVVFGGVGVGGGSGGQFAAGSLNGTDGFIINGANAHGQIGRAASFIGDVNDDGVNDMVIGASAASPNGIHSGESYVVFGGAGVGAGGAFELSSLNGASGFVINGVNARDFSGVSVSSAGDINGDGVGDLVIGAHGADPNGGYSGASYVVFGGVGVGVGGTLELSALDGINGFVINGVNTGDFSGYSVSGVGDVNGDGVDDLIIGAYRADPNGLAGAGVSYVVFGRAACTGDLNDDGVVDTADLGILLGQFGTAGPGADLNGDGVVDTADLGILLGVFGAGCP